MTHHPHSGQLREAVRRCLAQAEAWEGTFYRATTVEYANRQDLLAGIGARKAGGRWNPPGTFSAVYGSLEPETAMAEALANYREFGIPVSEAMPLVFVAVNVKLQSVLDLTQRDLQRKLRLSKRRMTSSPWQVHQRQQTESLTQAVGRLAWEAKLEALLVPSARRSGETNIEHRDLSRPTEAGEFLANQACPQAPQT